MDLASRDKVDFLRVYARTAYLAEVFQIQLPRPMYNHCPQDLIDEMISQYHEATATELQLAAEGKLPRHDHCSIPF